MSLKGFIETLRSKPETVKFADTMQVIEQNYQFVEVAFSNGDVRNNKGENNGSCKIFSFAQLNKLPESQTLSCFGEYYQDVLATPDGDDHQNIRNFTIMGSKFENYYKKNS